MSEMPKWPEPLDTVWADNCFPPPAQKSIQYERARAEAAIERLRVAVKALDYARGVLLCHMFTDNPVIRRIDTAIQAIGEIPND